MQKLNSTTTSVHPVIIFPETSHLDHSYVSHILFSLHKWSPHCAVSSDRGYVYRKRISLRVWSSSCDSCSCGFKSIYTLHVSEDLLRTRCLRAKNSARTQFKQIHGWYLYRLSCPSSCQLGKYCMFISTAGTLTESTYSFLLHVHCCLLTQLSCVPTRMCCCPLRTSHINSFPNNK